VSTIEPYKNLGLEHFTCGSDLREAIPPPPREFFNTKFRPLIPGTSYLKFRREKIIYL